MANLRKDQVITGAARTIVILDESSKQIVGRGSKFSWKEEYEVYPVDEYGVNGVNELAQGRMKAGTGSIETYYIFNQMSELPTRNAVLNKSYTIYEVSTADDNLILNIFKGVRFTSLGGDAGATDLYKINAEIMYINRMSPEEAKSAGEEAFSLEA